MFAVAPGNGAAPTAPAGSPDADAVVLSPYVVTTEKDTGYYGASAMSGTRMNTNLEDLASPITVVTKEQMADFALLSMDDVFAYEAGTESTANFTDFSFDRNQAPVDNTSLNPLTANRIRGIGPANVAFGNFETSGRTPIDALDVDKLEIGRGPNSNIFGIGTASGTVNAVRPSANLSKNRTQVTTRVDSFSGYRHTLDLNRVLKPGVLAIRASAVAQRDGYQLKPSGFLTERYNGMVQFRPFSRTSIAGSYSYYHGYGNRPNSVMPRDGITPWIASGSPTWDPIAGKAKIGGTPLAAMPPTLTNLVQVGSVAFVDQGDITWWGQSRSNLANNNSPRFTNGPSY